MIRRPPTLHICSQFRERFAWAFNIHWSWTQHRSKFSNQAISVSGSWIKSKTHFIWCKFKFRLRIKTSFITRFACLSKSALAEFTNLKSTDGGERRRKLENSEVVRNVVSLQRRCTVGQVSAHFCYFCSESCPRKIDNKFQFQCLLIQPIQKVGGEVSKNQRGTWRMDELTCIVKHLLCLPALSIPCVLSNAIVRKSYTPALAPATIMANSPLTW